MDLWLKTIIFFSPAVIGIVGSIVFFYKTQTTKGTK